MSRRKLPAMNVEGQFFVQVLSSAATADVKGPIDEHA
jgi:hypothetical protein